MLYRDRWSATCWPVILGLCENREIFGMETMLSMFGKDILGACPKDLDDTCRTERQRLIDNMPLEEEELVLEYYTCSRMTRNLIVLIIVCISGCVF